MKKKIGLFLMAFMVLTSLVYAQPARSIVDSDYDALDVNADGSINVNTIATVTDATITSTVTPTGNSTLTSGNTTHGGWFTGVVLGTGVCKRVIVKATLTNTGDVYIGDATADASAKTGFPLDAGEVWIGTVDNINDVYITGTVSGETVSWTMEN